MRLFRIAIVLIVVFGVFSSASATTQALSRWGNLVDVAYRFTWYPQDDLQEMLKGKSEEYGKSLEEYSIFLIDELVDGSPTTGLIAPESFVSGKDWKMYYRLALAEFCLFLANDNEIYLENAKSALSVLSGKIELSSVAFWHYLFQAYSDLVKKDRDAFVSSVFQLWQNVILKLEADDILMMGSRNSKTEFVRNLPFLYENIAHLIITRAIFENAMPDLYPLGIIVVAINVKLPGEGGYKNIVESVVERMHGLKSDCSNLNFAVAFVEATANQYEFEDEKSASLVVSKYNLTRQYYELALSWANTSKGKAAILTQYMGFTNYIIRRLIDKDDSLYTNTFFHNIPGEGNGLIRKSMDLYDQLAQPEVQEGRFLAEGFEGKNNYFKAMHQLWDSLAKLLMMQSAYYETTGESKNLDHLQVAESPLLEYLSFFRKYAGEDSEIVPDNAFFLTAYTAKQLADLYRQVSNYSTQIEINNLAFDYQLKAVEMFPMDIAGILQLAHQSNQEGRLNRYLQETGPVASRFRNSKVSNIWAEKVDEKYKIYIGLVPNVVPDIIDRAYFLVRILQQSGSDTSEEALCQKAIVMTRLLMALRINYSEEIIEDALSTIAKQNLNNKKAGKIIQSSLPKDLRDEAKSIPGIETIYHFTGLKNELYGSIDHAIHSYLRDLYYEGAGK